MTDIKALHETSLRVKIPRLLKIMEEESSLDFRTALHELYNSQLFADLQDEPTKIWHFSEYLLYDLWRQEKTTGVIVYPDV
jgi:hypothetical protein